MIYRNHKELLKYSKIETHGETSKSGDRSLAIPVELPSNQNNYQLKHFFISSIMKILYKKTTRVYYYGSDAEAELKHVITKY